MTPQDAQTLNEMASVAKFFFWCFAVVWMIVVMIRLEQIRDAVRGKPSSRETVAESQSEPAQPEEPEEPVTASKAGLITILIIIIVVAIAIIVRNS